MARKIWTGAWLVGFFVVALAATPVHAITADFTAAACDPPGGTCTQTINGGIFSTTLYQAAGSGVIQSFVRISANKDQVQGYNTDFRTGGGVVVFDENNSATFTHSLLLSDVGIVTQNGTDYRLFQLDINQNNSDPLLSLDKVQIFQATTGNLGGNSFSGGQLVLGGTNTLVYNMDVGADGDSTVLMNYNFNAGSGVGDLSLLVPNSLFDPANGSFVYLYSSFGGAGSAYINNDGYEEWNTITGTPVQTPEPFSLLLLGSGLTGVGLWGLKRRKALEV